MRFSYNWFRLKRNRHAAAVKDFERREETEKTKEKEIGNAGALSTMRHWLSQHVVQPFIATAGFAFYYTRQLYSSKGELSDKVNVTEI